MSRDASSACTKPIAIRPSLSKHFYTVHSLHYFAVTARNILRYAGMLDAHLCVAPVCRFGKGAGVKLNLAKFLRVQCGEGLEAAKSDFANEVAAMAQGQ